MPTPPVLTPSPGQQDSAGWSSQHLAATLVMTGAKMGDAAAIRHAAALVVGGIVLFSPTSPNLAQMLVEAKPWHREVTLLSSPPMRRAAKSNV